MFCGERKFSRTWQCLQKRFPEAGVRVLTLHCTRHTFITRALEAGAPAAVVAGWVGASAKAIAATYEHVIPTQWSVDFLDREHKP